MRGAGWTQTAHAPPKRSGGIVPLSVPLPFGVPALGPRATTKDALQEKRGGG